MTTTRVQVVLSLLRSSLERSHFAPEYCKKSLKSLQIALEDDLNSVLDLKFDGNSMETSERVGISSDLE